MIILDIFDNNFSSFDTNTIPALYYFYFINFYVFTLNFIFIFILFSCTSFHKIVWKNYINIVIYCSKCCDILLPLVLGLPKFWIIPVCLSSAKKCWGHFSLLSIFQYIFFNFIYLISSPIQTHTLFSYDIPIHLISLAL